MPALQIVSSKPVAGKTTIAVALAQGLAAHGLKVRLERVGSSDAATADATTFAAYLFTSSSGVALAQPPQTDATETLILELDAGSALLAGMPAIVALHSAPSVEDTALAASLGERLIGTIAVAVDPQSVESVAREITNGGLRPLALLPEDRALTAPSVSEIGQALDAHLLYDGENDLDVVDDVLIAPVFSDPARPHFRRFASKAVLSPFNKTDLHLAAIEAEAACLVITGGKDPSPYILDRAQHGTTTVFLSSQDTPGTVAALADVWSKTRFRGDSKAAAAYALLEQRMDFPGLIRKLES